MTTHPVVLAVGDVARRLQLAAQVWGLEVRKAPAVPPLPAERRRLLSTVGPEVS